MRRLLCLVACASILAGVVPPAGAAEYGVTNGVMAIAIWTEPIPGTRYHDVYWAFGVQGLEDGELKTYGGLGHFKCSTNGWGIVQLFCFRGRIRRLTEGEFTIDPTLGEAHLAIERKGLMNEVKWTASDAPEVSQESGQEGPFAWVGASFDRDASLEATIMGERFDGQRSFARMQSGASVLIDTSD
jgi:hypothetical protein